MKLVACALAVCLQLSYGQAAFSRTLEQSQPIFVLSKSQAYMNSLGAYGLPAKALIRSKSYRGTYISKLDNRLPGYLSGLRRGDVVLSINEKVTENPDTLSNVIERFSGQKVRVKIARLVQRKMQVVAISARWKFRDPQAVASKGKVLSSQQLERLESFAFQLINQDRFKHGNLPKLRQSKQLGRLARAYAREMSNKNFFAHVNPSGVRLEERVVAHGIGVHVSENLAYQKGSHFVHCVRLCQNALMNEPANEDNHRANILNPNNKSVGLGVALMNNGKGIILVQEFSEHDLP